MLISVCIPAYNQTKYLEKTLESVFAQLDVEFEVIISDDSTNDEVFYLAKKFSEKFTNIYYVKNSPSLGSPENWNYAISLAKGEYIKILHHDEWFLKPNALKRLYDIGKLNKNYLVYSSSKSINKGVENDFTSSDDIAIEINKKPEKLILGNQIGGPSAVFFHSSKKELFDSNLIWLVDIDFYISLLKKNKCQLKFVDDFLYLSVIDTHNITNQCISDSELLIREYCYLFRKHLKKSNYFKQVYYFYCIYKILLSNIQNPKFLLLRMIKKIYYVQR